MAGPVIRAAVQDHQRASALAQELREELGERRDAVRDAVLELNGAVAVRARRGRASALSSDA